MGELPHQQVQLPRSRVCDACRPMCGPLPSCSVFGPKGRHDPQRTAVRHGSEAESVTLGGLRAPVRRPRVRAPTEHAFGRAARRPPVRRGVGDRDRRDQASARPGRRIDRERNPRHRPDRRPALASAARWDQRGETGRDEVVGRDRSVRCHCVEVVAARGAVGAGRQPASAATSPAARTGTARARRGRPWPAGSRPEGDGSPAPATSRGSPSWETRWSPTISAPRSPCKTVSLASRRARGPRRGGHQRRSSGRSPPRQPGQAAVRSTNPPRRPPARW